MASDRSISRSVHAQAEVEQTFHPNKSSHTEVFPVVNERFSQSLVEFSSQIPPRPITNSLEIRTLSAGEPFRDDIQRNQPNKIDWGNAASKGIGFIGAPVIAYLASSLSAGLGFFGGFYGFAEGRKGQGVVHAGKNAFIIGGGYLAAVAIGTVAFPPLAAFYLAGAVAGSYLAGWGVGRLFRKS